MKSILFGLFLVLVLSVTARAAESSSSCYSGQFSLGDNEIHLKYQVKDNMLHVEVLNPDDLMATKSGVPKPVKELFKPGPDMKLVLLNGVKCPCEALQTEKGNFNFIVEHLGDGSTRATMDYFGFRSGEVQAESCAK